LTTTAVTTFFDPWRAARSLPVVTSHRAAVPSWCPVRAYLLWASKATASTMPRSPSLPCTSLASRVAASHGRPALSVARWGGHVARPGQQAALDPGLRVPHRHAVGAARHDLLAVGGESEGLEGALAGQGGEALPRFGFPHDGPGQGGGRGHPLAIRGEGDGL